MPAQRTAKNKPKKTRLCLPLGISSAWLSMHKPSKSLLDHGPRFGHPPSDGGDFSHCREKKPHAPNMYTMKSIFLVICEIGEKKLFKNIAN